MIVSSEPTSSRRRACFEIVLVTAIFALFGGWPVPDPNEPYYLGKAKHFWDPAWAAGDFFLDTRDAHQVFYFTCGWASLYLPLPAFAWCGRFLTWWLLAWGWRRLSWAIVPRPWAALLTATLFAWLQEWLQMAGEWVIGGFEAKGLAYAGLLFALEAIVRGRWLRGAAWCGVATSFHVLVGGWSVVAAGIAWLGLGKDRPPWRVVAGCVLIAGVLAAPGLATTLVLARGVAGETQHAANVIYVFERLGHHLDIFNFRADFVIKHVLFAVGFLPLLHFWKGWPESRRLWWMVSGGLTISACGAVLSAALHGQSMAADILRFYWFRLGDVLLPIGWALWFGDAAFQVRILTRRATSGVTDGIDWATRRPLVVTAVAIGAIVLAFDVWRRPLAERPRADKEKKVDSYEDWRSACEWIAQNAPSDAVFLTPRTAQTFKWYAHRAEIANWKEIPQDAPGIVAWWKRLEDLHREVELDGAIGWHDAYAEQPVERVRELTAMFATPYVITVATPPLPFEVLYRNDTYCVYSVR